VIKVGQYYYAVNITKKEYIRPWDVGGVAKLWEWGANITQAGLLVLLLGWSNSSGGGDPDWDDPQIKMVAGRWAGDRVALVGDYYSPDEKDLPTWDTIEEEYLNISLIVIPAWNKFIEIEKYKIKPKLTPKIRPDMVISNTHGKIVIRKSPIVK